jgi:membrane protease YdiL (CAAX protease family)
MLVTHSAITTEIGRTMGSVSAIWQRIPVAVRAILTGLLVLFFGAFGWSVLLFGSRKLTTSIPWAATPIFLVVGCLFLWGFWRYLAGAGWPRSSAEGRRQNLRGRGLPGSVWAWALSAGVLAVISYVALVLVWGRLIRLQPWTVPDLSRYSFLTVLCILLAAAVEAGVVEEASFRGYMQAPIERRYGPKVAIVIVSLVFGFVHLANGYHELTWLLPYAIFGSILGTLAYLTNSILPGVVLHTAGDAVRFLFVWRHGPNPHELLIWQSGLDLSFCVRLAIAVTFGLAAIWAYRKLATVVRLESKSS